MEDGSSPRRNLQPLLEGEASPNVMARSGSDGYAPPSENGHQRPSAAAAAALQPPPSPSPSSQVHQQPHHQLPNDLSFTVTNGDGSVVIMEEDEGEDLGQLDVPQLPPLISYMSYVKYFCAFGKYLIVFVIINVIGLVIVLTDDYFGYQGDIPFDSWKGFMLAIIWLVTAVWLFISARIVEQDVEKYDQMAQYEHAHMTDDTDTHHQYNGGGGNFAPIPSSTTTFLPNYTAIYGQVSRKVDEFFTKRNSARDANNNSNNEGGTGGESCNSSLVNASYALWALALGGGIFLLIGTILGKHYIKSCDRKSNLPSGGNSTGNDSEFQGDFANIEKYPLGVQEWITEKKDPWDYPRHSEYDDDFHEDSMVPTYDGKFPTAFETDTGLFCQMFDGTIFFAGQPPSIHQTGEGGDDDDNDSYTTNSRSDHLVLVEIRKSDDNSAVPTSVEYHYDVINPRMFLPAGKGMMSDTDDTYLASNCCFVAANTDKDSKQRQRNWDSIIRTSPMYCMNREDADVGYTLEKKMIAWTDRSQRGPKLSAASTGSEVLIAHIGMDNNFNYQEIVSLTPNAMETKTVYHMTRSQSDAYYYDDFGSRRDHEQTKCVQKHVIVFATIATLVVLVLSSLWLLLREGIPSGVVPLMYAVVIAIYAIGEAASGGRDNFRYLGRGWTSLALTIGTFFFYIVLCCGANGRRRACPCLPGWIGNEIYVWALYSWITAFLILDAIAGDGDVVALALVYFAISGLILDHPTVILM